MILTNIILQHFFHYFYCLPKKRNIFNELNWIRFLFTTIKSILFLPRLLINVKNILYNTILRFFIMLVKYNFKYDFKLLSSYTQLI